jgi:putative ABC transport system ATP-binding protein
MSLIELKDITKEYPLDKTIVKALRGINLTIEKGAFISIIGPSGSGKTTLLNIIGCVDHSTQGSYHLEGEDISHFTDNQLTALRLYKIGFIFQSFNLIPVLSVVENVEFPLLLQKDISKEEARKRALDIIEQVQIGQYANHRPADLSGGQRQRVAIARALVTQPKIVLADEPTANLDSETGNAILSLMQKLNQEKSTTFIFSTHDPEVLKYAKSIIKIKDGQLLSA